MTNNKKKDMSRREFLQRLGIGAGSAVAMMAFEPFGALARTMENDRLLNDVDNRMTYRTQNGSEEQISLLGFGMMRLPDDQEKVNQMVDYAIAHGVNYFDTAWPYHNGTSELVMGECLKKYPRESFYLANKFPGHQVMGNYDPAPIFEKQLQKCQVDYFDFYLLHNVCENSLVFYNDPEIRIVEYLLKQKELGKIRHLGFSSHAVSAATIDEFLTRYEGVFEFVQIQLNYLDWILQDAKSKVEVIAKHGLKIVVMEGVRGGRLA